MLRLPVFSVLVLCWGLLVVASPLHQAEQAFLSSSVHPAKGRPRPLVIWHGLGDTALSKGVQSFIDDIQALYPGIFVYSVQIPLDGSLEDERKAGFWGDAEEQGDAACEQISALPELADGFDGIGFSQGGLWLRRYAQYCSGPPIHNLISFGAPQYGIASPIPCSRIPSPQCLLAARAAKVGIYRPWAQKHLIQAQYYRDPARMEEFLQTNTFIRDMNAEGKFLAGVPEGDGGKGVVGLQNMILVMFDKDRVVDPADSPHFATYSSTNKSQLISLYDQPLYKEDWIGLRELNERGRLRFEHCPGAHMDLGGEGGCLDVLVREWIGWSR